MKLAFIGAGNMGGAAAIGLHRSDPSLTINVSARHQSTLERFAGTGIGCFTNNCEAVKGADIVFLVVKPWQMEAVVGQLKEVLDYGRQLIVSMAPGIRSDSLLAMLGGNPSVAYVIPNTAIEICESMTFIAPVSADAGQISTLEALFSKTGSCKVVEERLLGAGTALASCGIAYAMRYLRASAEGGVEMGFYPNDAIDIVCQTMIGAAGIVKAHGSHPEAEIDKVTTPGGMTIKGLNAMEEAGFTDAVIKGLKAGK